MHDFVKYHKPQKHYCLAERKIMMQRRDLRGRGLEVGLERWAALEWMGEGATPNLDPGKARRGLGTKV